MGNGDLLPFVVHVDDSNEPGDVLDTLALEPFIAGRHPIAQTQHLNRVRSDASFIPRQSSGYRSAHGRWRSVVLAEGSGWMLKATIWRDNTATLIVTATDQELAGAILAEVTSSVAEPPPPPGHCVQVGFWHLSNRGPLRSERTIEVSPWSSIRRNYTTSAAIALDELMALSADKLRGRLLLLHGPPGTGKTSVVRALGQEWREWCAVECILDPEYFLRGAGYLTSVLLGDGDDGEDEMAGRWRLLVLEDCDEVVRSGARAGVGQALSRLLNLTDGLLGQGRNVLICITTNEDLSRFHPAVVRPGRCLEQIEIGPLSRDEAAAWLGVDAADWPAGATLADLYATLGGHQVSSRYAHVGQYL
jgi:hypothetical protein